MNTFLRPIHRPALVLLGFLLLLPLSLGAQTRSEIRSVLVTIQTQDVYGRTRTLRIVSEPKIKVALGAARSLLLDGLLSFTDYPQLPVPYIFQCGGDFEHSDGTCANVIVACATIGIKFNCNKYDDEGVCTNGGC